MMGGSRVLENKNEVDDDEVIPEDVKNEVSHSSVVEENKNSLSSSNKYSNRKQGPE